jgi:hypothetical protein
MWSWFEPRGPGVGTKTPCGNHMTPSGRTNESPTQSPGHLVLIGHYWNNIREVRVEVHTSVADLSMFTPLTRW